MSTIIIHKTEAATFATTNYGDRMKAYMNWIKTQLTAEGATVAETVISDTASVYDVMWIINNRYKIEYKNTNANVTAYLYHSPADADYGHASLIRENYASILTNSGTAGVFSVNIYLGVHSLVLEIQGINTGWNNARVVSAVFSPYTLQGTQTTGLALHTVIGNNSYTRRYYGISQDDPLRESGTSNYSLKWWFPDISGGVELAYTSLTPADDARIVPKLNPAYYNSDPIHVMTDLYCGPTIGYGLEVEDQNSLYLAYGSKWIRI